MKLWTRQHTNVYNKILSNGRFVMSSDEYICFDMKEQKHIILFCYDWLQKNCPKQNMRPKDSKYHIWTTYSKETSYMGDENSVLLELDVPEDNIIRLNVAKWTCILDYLYIPIDKKDKKVHDDKIHLLGLNDTQIVMSNFYPELKKEIVDSWQRLFDDSINWVNDISYGLIWEIREEWVVNYERFH